MTFNAALSNAISGMNAATTAIQVRGHNIANAGTEGYARRDIALSPRSPSGGVLIAGITRSDAGRAAGLALGAGASAEDARLRAEGAEAVSIALGLPGDETGLYAAMAGFETALADLAGTPESPSLQQGLLTAASRLSGTFGRIGDEAQALRSEADAGIAAGVASVNDALAALHALNGTRGGAHNTGGLDALPEQRQALIDTIGAELDIRVRTNALGQTEIHTASGVPLLTGEPSFLEFRASGVVAADQTRAGGALSGLSAGGIDLTPGTVQGIGAGRLAGHFATRDQTAPAFANRLDALAEDIASRLAAADADGAGQGLLHTTAGPGAASRLAVNAAADPSQGGDLFRLRDGLSAAAPGPVAASGVLPALQDALSQRLPGPSGLSVTATGGIETLASALGTERLAAEGVSAAAGARAQGARDQVLAATGVNTDQELQSLLLIEQAYAANARVVQAVSDMMRRLTEI